MMNKSEKKQQQGTIEKIRIFAANETVRFLAGMTIFLLGVFLFSAIASYTISGYSDYTLLDGAPSQAANHGGSIGAHLAEILVNGCFGLSAIAIPFFLCIAGINIIVGHMDYRYSRLFWICTFLMIWISFTLGFVLPTIPFLPYIHLAGKHGEFMSATCEQYIGFIGTMLVILASFVAFVVVTFVSVLPAIKAYIARKNAEREARKLQKANTPENIDPNPAQNDIDGFDINNLTGNDNNTSGNDIPETPDTPETPEKPDDNTDNSNISGDDNKNNAIDPDQNGCDGDDTDGDEKMTVSEGTVEAMADKLVARYGEYDPTLELAHYKLPDVNLLRDYKVNTEIDMDEQNSNKIRITETLRNYGITIKEIMATVGPTITLYEIVPGDGIRVARIKSLSDDIALSLKAQGIRIIAPMPGKGTIGIEVPNEKPQMVPMRPIIMSQKFQETDYDLPLAFGRTITNEIYMVDLCKMPHMLVAGATGQGKSVGLNAMIASLLYKKHPATLKFVMVDPKKVEFSIYSTIENHFLAKLPDNEDAIITDVTKVIQTLQSLCKEMDTRYDLLKQAKCRNIKEYNTKFLHRELNPEHGHHFMPYFVIIIDEFGDLIMTAGKEVELPIARIAQLARAVGMHMIIATQRPTTNIITGTIKANFPARMAFRTSAAIDSRTILDAQGADKLIGKGDMLFSGGGQELVRLQCAFVDTPEIEQICNNIGDQQGYGSAFMLPEVEYSGMEDGMDTDLRGQDLGKRDALFDEVARMVVLTQQGSTSNIQRKFSLGYNRAGKLMDQLEAAGIVGAQEPGGKPRKVLIPDELTLDTLLKTL